MPVTASYIRYIQYYSPAFLLAQEQISLLHPQLLLSSQSGLVFLIFLVSWNRLLLSWIMLSLRTLMITVIMLHFVSVLFTLRGVIAAFYPAFTQKRTIPPIQTVCYVSIILKIVVLTEQILFSAHSTFTSAFCSSLVSFVFILGW